MLYGDNINALITSLRRQGNLETLFFVSGGYKFLKFSWHLSELKKELWVSDQMLRNLQPR